MEACGDALASGLAVVAYFKDDVVGDGDGVVLGGVVLGVVFYFDCPDGAFAVVDV